MRVKVAKYLHIDFLEVKQRFDEMVCGPYNVLHDGTGPGYGIQLGISLCGKLILVTNSTDSVKLPIYKLYRELLHSIGCLIFHVHSL